MKSIEKEWKQFEAACIHENACEAQREDMKRAYYAGGISFLTLLNGPLNETEGKSVNDRIVAVLSKIDELRVEMSEFIDTRRDELGGEDGSKDTGQTMDDSPRRRLFGGDSG